MKHLARGGAAALALVLVGTALATVPASATSRVTRDTWQTYTVGDYPTPNRDNVPSAGWYQNNQPTNFMYVWAGAEGRTAPDRLITFGFDPNSNTYGKKLYETEIPAPFSNNNEPHHCGVSMDSKTMVCGGLLAPAKSGPNDWLFFFDLSDPARPRFAKSMKTKLASYPDDFIALPDGGFLFTEMGGATVGSPGRLARLDGNGNLVGEYPAKPPKNYNPHGIAARLDLNLAVTCDYIDVPSTLNTYRGEALVRSSVEVFNLKTMKIAHRIQLPKGTATMDCKMLNHDRRGRGYVGGSGNGKLYLFDAKGGTAKMVYDVNKIAPGALTQYMQISQDDTRLYVPYFSDWTTERGKQIKSGRYSGIVVFDITNPAKPRALQHMQLPAYAGPHMSMLVDHGNKLLVTDYLLDEDNIGKVHFDGDHYVRGYNVQSDGTLIPDPWLQISLNDLDPGLMMRPHGLGLHDMGMDMSGMHNMTMPGTNLTSPNPAGSDPSGTGSGTDQSGTDQAGTDQSGSDQTGTDQSGTDQTGSDQSGTDQSGADQTDTDQSGTDQLGTGQSGIELDTSGIDMSGMDMLGN